MSRPRVVIVGGGFAGAFTARYLRKCARKKIDVELINAENYFVFQPLLPEVASGTISAPDAVTPLRYMLPGIKVRMAEVTDLDASARTLRILQGSRRTPQSVSYDHLVIAVGQKTNLSISPGFQEHGLCMRNLADAHQLRNKVIRRLEHADVTNNAALKKRLLTFVVAGGGFSGVETIGELAEMIRRTLKFYPNIQTSDIRTVLIQRDQELLPELASSLGRYTVKKLQSRHVEVICGRSIVAATAHAVMLDDGTRIETNTLVITVGNSPRPFTENLGVALTRGKIRVDEYLRVVGTENIWALGDAAMVPLPRDNGDKPCFAPPTAQYAVKEAQYVAKNIASVITGKPLRAFSYKPMGSLASIGNYKAVAEVFGIKLSGLFAWLLWRAIYIGMLPGFSTRVRVALNWLFDYFLPRSIVQIANNSDSATHYRCYAKGDIVSAPGQIVDGFYSVVSGCLESRIPDADGGDDFVRMLGPGDHWGERSLNENTMTFGTLTAIDDTRLMVLPATDFNNLCAAFPALDNYFKSISDTVYAPSLRRQASDDADNTAARDIGET